MSDTVNKIWKLKEKDGTIRTYTTIPSLLKKLNISNNRIVEVNEYTLTSSDKKKSRDLYNEYMILMNRDVNMDLINDVDDKGFTEAQIFKNYIFENCRLNNYWKTHIENRSLTKSSLKSFITENKRFFMKLGKSVEYYELLLGFQNFREDYYMSKIQLKNFKVAKENRNKSI